MPFPAIIDQLNLWDAQLEQKHAQPKEVHSKKKSATGDTFTFTGCVQDGYTSNIDQYRTTDWLIDDVIQPCLVRTWSWRGLNNASMPADEDLGIALGPLEFLVTKICWNQPNGSKVLDTPWHLIACDLLETLERECRESLLQTLANSSQSSQIETFAKGILHLAEHFWCNGAVFIFRRFFFTMLKHIFWEMNMGRITVQVFCDQLSHFT